MAETETKTCEACGTETDTLYGYGSGRCIRCTE